MNQLRLPSRTGPSGCGDWAGRFLLVIRRIGNSPVTRVTAPYILQAGSTSFASLRSFIDAALDGPAYKVILDPLPVENFFVSSWVLFILEEIFQMGPHGHLVEGP